MTAPLERRLSKHLKAGEGAMARLCMVALGLESRSVARFTLHRMGARWTSGKWTLRILDTTTGVIDFRRLGRNTREAASSVLELIDGGHLAPPMPSSFCPDDEKEVDEDVPF